MIITLNKIKHLHLDKIYVLDVNNLVIGLESVQTKIMCQGLMIVKINLEQMLILQIVLMVAKEITLEPSQCQGRRQILHVINVIWPDTTQEIAQTVDK